MASPVNPKPKLLVVDDEPDNLDLLYRTFRRDYRVFRAESGPAALDLLSREKDIAVIISDQRMPMMSGTEFLSLTASQYPDIMRIILTGYTDVEDLVEAINSGKVFKFVTKPWDDEELKVVVQQAIDTHNVLRNRTRELFRSLRQESLINAITSTIRSDLNHQQISQAIVDTVGQAFEVDLCLLRSFEGAPLSRESFIYENPSLTLLHRSKGHASGASHPAKASVNVLPDPHRKILLQETVLEIRETQVIDNWAEFEAASLPTVVWTEESQHAYQTLHIEASLLVPLLYKQELMAVLALHQTQPRSWQEDEQQILRAVADQAALALAQSRAYEQVQALAQRETLVNTITTAIRSSLEPQVIFAAITEQLGQALMVDGCALSLWSDGDEFVQCVGLYEREPSIESLSSLPQSVVPIHGNPVLQQLLATQQPVVIEDLSHRPELNGLDLPLQTPARSLLLVPLLTEGKIIGSISLRQVRTPRNWQAAEVELAQAVATQAAIAVQQARLFQTSRQQAEKLLELDRQKTEFFQNISHEFRTPLTLTIGPLEAAIAQQQGLSYEQSVISLRNSRRLLRLVNQLLDLQRLDAGRMQPSFRPCNLVEFVSQIVETFHPYCQRKGIELGADLQPCSPVYLDAEKFDKVIYNLLSNAMKFTPAGGRIIVTVQPTGNHCLLKVQDTGIGIREDQIPHLFERFRQAEGSENRSYEGSGLGLSLVKELVEVHGGQVTVDSLYGQGATFSVWLPTGMTHLPPEQVIEVPTMVQLNRAAIELADLELELGAEIPEAVPQPDSSPESTLGAAPSESSLILVVDDNPDLRGYVTTILRQAGYRTSTARNGAEGFRVATQQHPDLIVTDLMMPLVSGLDMIQMIRSESRLQGIPIILLTAKANEEVRIEGTERGADAYLSKPFNNRELLAEVRNLLALKANERRVAELNTYLTESVLKRFLPPSLVQKAAAGQLSLDLRPEPRMVTILFSDIVGFTQLANTLRSRRVAQLLNEYLAEMTRAVFDNGGTVDKFMGDAILALFGAPEELTPNEQVRRAIATARQMHESLAILNQRWQEQGIQPVQFRCGIHQGTVVVGMFGNEERSDYTAIGPGVNIAARLQEAAEPGLILVSAAVADYLDESEIIKYSPLHLKGLDETVLTFAVKMNPVPQTLSSLGES